MRAYKMTTSGPQYAALTLPSSSVPGSTHVDPDELVKLVEDMNESNKIASGMLAQKAQYQYLYHDEKGMLSASTAATALVGRGWCVLVSSDARGRGAAGPC